jgi:hypothetical protein
VADKKPCKVFISYSRHDEALIKPIASLLVAAGDDAVFLDVTSLKSGDCWEEEIIRAVKESLVFVLCWCCESAKSDFVTKEIKTALKDRGKKLIPVLLCSEKLPTAFARRQWIDLRSQVVHKCEVKHIETVSLSQHLRQESLGVGGFDSASEEYRQKRMPGEDGVSSDARRRKSALSGADRLAATSLAKTIRGYFNNLAQ